MYNQDIYDVNLSESFNIGENSNQLKTQNIINKEQQSKYPSEIKSRENSQFKSKANNSQNYEDTIKSFFNDVMPIMSSRAVEEAKQAIFDFDLSAAKISDDKIIGLITPPAHTQKKSDHSNPSFENSQQHTSKDGFIVTAPSKAGTGLLQFAGGDTQVIQNYYLKNKTPDESE